MNRPRMVLVGLSALLVSAASVFAGPDCGQVFDRGLRLYQKGIVYSADVLFHEVLAECPNHAGANYYLGKLSTDGDSAASLFRQALKGDLAPGLADQAQLELAQYSLAKGLYADAAKLYEDVAQSAFDSTLAWDSRMRSARSMRLAGESGAAKKAYWELLPEAEGPAERARALAGLGDCSFGGKELLEASTHYHNALACTAAELEGYLVCQLYRVYSQMGDSAKAGEYLRKLQRGFGHSLAMDAASGQNRALVFDTVATRLTKATMGRQYWVQVGAFSSVVNAKRLKRELERKLSLASPLKAIVLRSGDLQLVRIGAFPTEHGALSFGLQNVKPLKYKFYVKVTP